MFMLSWNKDSLYPHKKNMFHGAGWKPDEDLSTTYQTIIQSIRETQIHLLTEETKY